jgi:uncharacterized membrane protein SpoIIM required for sporulation
MREAVFVKRNQERWQHIEKDLSHTNPDPDRLAAIFIQVTDDLSFAQTRYPGSRVTQYLNRLATQIHHHIYRNKRERTNRLLSFWQQEVPAEIFRSRREVIYALLVFLASISIGYLSALHDETFVRLILGDTYVNMTLENIRQGKPLAVYGQSESSSMFLTITFNNIRVAFMTFAMGIVFSIGSAYMLFYNGIMAGTFFAFFRKAGLMMHALPVIMLHGTLELTSIVIAGAAGFAMGNGFLFPGTYPRLTAFRMGAKRGLKIVIGLVPLFILAGFIESFITRYEFMPAFVKLLIIGLSAAGLIYYFVFLPYKLSLHGKPHLH